MDRTRLANTGSLYFIRYGPTASIMPASFGSVERRWLSALRMSFGALGAETRMTPPRICHCMRRLPVAAALLAGAVFAAWSQETDPIIKVDVDLVSVLFSARDKRGGLVPNLTKD